MRLKLNEAVKPLKFYENDISRRLLPALEREGFILPKLPEIISDYAWKYKGFYKSPEGNSIPAEFTFSTSSPFIDETVDNAFAQLVITGNKYNLGGFDLRNPESLIDNISGLFTSGDIQDPKDYANRLAISKDLIPARNDPTIQLTKEEWKADFLNYYRDYLNAWNAVVADPDNEEVNKKWEEEWDNFNRYYLASVYPDSLEYPKEYYQSGEKYIDKQHNANLRNEVFNKED